MALEDPVPLHSAPHPRPEFMRAVARGDGNKMEGEGQGQGWEDLRAS